MKALLACLALLGSGANAQTFEQSLNAGFSAVSAGEPVPAALAAEPEDAESAEDYGEPAVDLAALPDKVDLSHYWADGPRDQAPLLACHAFAAVGLLEAGVFRATGERLRLSEADLFVRTTALRGIRSSLVRENGLLREDLNIALESGVVPGDWHQEFVARYKDFGRLEPLRGKQEGLEKLLPEAATPAAKAGREKVASKSFASLELKGESIIRYAGTAARTMVKGSAVSCRVKAKRRDRIMRRLAAGIPLGAGILLNGVEDPNLNAKRDEVGGQHYVILTGYKRAPKGVVFTMRNSWGKRAGWDAVLTESDLCALFALTWVALPGDRR